MCPHKPHAKFMSNASSNFRGYIIRIDTTILHEPTLAGSLLELAQTFARTCGTLAKTPRIFAGPLRSCTNLCGGPL